MKRTCLIHKDLRSLFCIVASVLDAEESFGQNAFTNMKGKNDRSVLFPSKPEM